MIITIDTAQPLSSTDVGLLAHLVSGYLQQSTEERAAKAHQFVAETLAETTGPIGPGIQENAGEPAAEPVAEEKPKRKRRTKAEMEAARAAEAEAEQADEPEEAPADLPAPPEVHEEGQPTAFSEPSNVSPTTIEKFRAEAVELATNLVAQGNRPAVKAALEAIGEPKVSAIPDDKLAAFIGALKS